jgi:hypothetical protein
VPLLKALFSKASAKVIHFSETTKLLWIFFEKILLKSTEQLKMSYL